MLVCFKDWREGMRVVVFIIVFLMLCGFVYVEEFKFLVIQVGEVKVFIVEVIGFGFSCIVIEFMVGIDGMVGDVVRKNFKMQDKCDREVNRGVCKFMKECIKFGCVINDEMKECMKGIGVKDW